MECKYLSRDCENDQNTSYNLMIQSTLDLEELINYASDNQILKVGLKMGIKSALQVTQ